MKYIKGAVILSVSSFIKKFLPIIYLLALVSAEILFHCYGSSVTTYLPNVLTNEINLTT
jgi:hypothetical protein